jgi:iron complex outermembrane recepter protein
VFKLNLRLFVDMDQQKSLVKSLPWLKGGRFSIMANNLLDSRQKITDATGATPLGYQADYLDPMGRVLGVEFRKSF